MRIASNGPATSPTVRATRSPHRVVRPATAALALVAGLLVVVPAASANVAPDSGPYTGGTEVTVPVPGADSFLEISGGSYHSLALDADANLWSWGRDNFGQVGNGATTGDIDTPTQITTGTAFTTIAAGDFQSLAVDSDGNLWSWGNDGNGQLGNGATTGDVTTPTQITTGVEYAAIAAGNYHSLALDSDGNLWTWGGDFYGQVGNGATTGDVTTPTQVTTGVEYTAIAAGASHSLALDINGNVWTWGWDHYGQVGNGATTGDVDTPTPLTTGATHTTIAAGDLHSLALDTNGNLWTWGNDTFGQIGNGATTGDIDTPTQVPSGTTYTTIAAGAYYSLALDTNGNLWTWGNDTSGQLGNGATTGIVTTPTPLTTGSEYTSVAAGYAHSLALDTDGNLWTWGWDDFRQVGNGATTGDVTTPTHVTAGTDYATIASGYSHSLALDADGNLWAWGLDTSGQVGNGATTVYVTTPTQITSGTTFTTIAAGESHSLALDADGNLWTWGSDNDGQLGNGATTGAVTTPAQITTGTTTFIAIAAGNAHSLALDTDGNLWTWGGDDFAQVGNGATTGNITTPTQITTGTTYTAIAGGDEHSLALDAAGNLWTWGNDTFGQLGNGATTGTVTAPTQVTTGTEYTSIAAGDRHALALDTDGNLWTWGNDTSGQVGNGATTGTVNTPTQVAASTEYTSIAAGFAYSLALDTDGNLWTWGGDLYGQLGNGATTGIVATPTRLGATTIITGILFDGVPGTGLQRLTETLANVTTPTGTPGAATITIQYSYDGETKPDLTHGQRFTYLATTPDAPTALAATPGDGEAALSWAAPTSDGGDTIADYLIEFSDNDGTTWTTFADGVSNATTATVTGLANSTEYTFRVSAVNSVGTGPSSATATATPFGAPDAPTALTATPGDGEVTLAWTAPASDGGDPITDYLIEHSNNGGITWTTFADGVSNGTTATVTWLTNGTDYSFRVTAVNSVGTSTPSTTATSTPLATTDSPGALPITGVEQLGRLVLLSALLLTTGLALALRNRRNTARTP